MKNNFENIIDNFDQNNDNEIINQNKIVTLPLDEYTNHSDHDEENEHLWDDFDEYPDESKNNEVTIQHTPNMNNIDPFAYVASLNASQNQNYTLSYDTPAIYDYNNLNSVSSIYNSVNQNQVQPNNNNTKYPMSQPIGGIQKYQNQQSNVQSTVTPYVTQNAFGNNQPFPAYYQHNNQYNSQGQRQEQIQQNHSQPQIQQGNLQSDYSFKNSNMSMSKSVSSHSIASHGSDSSGSQSRLDSVSIDSFSFTFSF